MAPSRHRRAITLAIGMLPLAWASAGRAATSIGPALDRPSMAVRQPERAVLLGAALAGRRIVAVGERGIVVMSDDGGTSWRQVATPLSVTLTAVRFADKDVGYAVGHGGSVLVSTDAGHTWTRKLDGQRIAQIGLDAALKRNDPAAIKAAKRLVAEGADKPLLDALVLDARRVVAFGAYGLAVATEDGGQTWFSWRARLDNPKELHLYSARQRGTRLLVTGEQGFVQLSSDGGATFKRLTTPYAGSFFTCELPDDDTIMVAGLRGNVWRSTDGGTTWKQIQSPVPATITSSMIDADGRLLFASQAGVVLALADGRLKPLTASPLPPLNFLLALEGQSLLTLSMDGALRIDLQAAARKVPAR